MIQRHGDEAEEDWPALKLVGLDTSREWKLEELERKRDNADKPTKPKQRKRSVYSGD